MGTNKMSITAVVIAVVGAILLGAEITNLMPPKDCGPQYTLFPQAVEEREPCIIVIPGSKDEELPALITGCKFGFPP